MSRPKLNHPRVALARRWWYAPSTGGFKDGLSTARSAASYRWVVVNRRINSLGSRMLRGHVREDVKPRALRGEWRVPGA